MIREDEVSDLHSTDLTVFNSDSIESTPRAHRTHPSSPDCDPTTLDKFDPTPQPTPTPSTETRITVYHIINVSIADNAFSLHMVEDGTPFTTSKTKNPASWSPTQELYEAIQFLGTVGFLNLGARPYSTLQLGCVWLARPSGYTTLFNAAAPPRLSELHSGLELDSSSLLGL